MATQFYSARCSPSGLPRREDAQLATKNGTNLVACEACFRRGKPDGERCAVELGNETRRIKPKFAELQGLIRLVCWLDTAVRAALRPVQEQHRNLIRQNAGFGLFLSVAERLSYVAESLRDSVLFLDES